MQNKNVKFLILAGLFTALTAVGAFIKIPFYPVPFTLQTFFTALAAIVLPPRWASLSQLAYLMVGLLGVPVFANGGGLGYVLQPTFGYLLLLPVAAFIISKLVLYYDANSTSQILIILLAGMFITLIGGALWLYIHFEYIVRKDVDLIKVLYAGVLLFVPSLFLKAIIVTLLWKKLNERVSGILKKVA